MNTGGRTICWFSLQQCLLRRRHWKGSQSPSLEEGISQKLFMEGTVETFGKGLSMSLRLDQSSEFPGSIINNRN
jgi:hypothetical protein